MRKILYLIGLFLAALIIGGSVILININNKKEQKNTEYYNVIYYNYNVSLEYHDVTDLHYDTIGIYFKTQDGATVILNGGAIEIIPLDVD